MEPVLGDVEQLTTVWYGGSGGAAPVSQRWAGPASNAPGIPGSAAAPGLGAGSLSGYSAVSWGPPGITIPPGAILSSRYRVEQPLGVGAFARVHAAWDLTLGRRVAVKICDSETAGQLAQDEMRLQASCQHPNLMPLHDAGSDSILGVTYLVMPLYPGSDLAGALERFGPMPFRTALLCMEQVCSALDFLWQRRQAPHGDVKAANIWLTQSGAALLMDFNLHGLLARGGCLRGGTPGFTAPEAMQGRLDSRSDVFSAGCVLYQCLAGVPPFATDAAACAGEYVPLRELRPDTRPELEAVVDTALSLDPDRRFQNARELQTALRYPARVMGISTRESGWRGAVLFAGRALAAGCRLGWGLLAHAAEGGFRLVSHLAQGGGRMLGWSAAGLGALLDRFFGLLTRRPLQAAVEVITLWMVGQWAFYVARAWILTHPFPAAAAAALAALLAASAGQAPRRRPRALAHHHRRK